MSLRRVSRQNDDRGTMSMKVLSGYRDGRLTLYLRGELGHHEAAAALRGITRTLDDYLPRDCVIDMGGLTFMDSSGIALILKIYKLMNETGGRAWVENAGRQPLKVLDASGIDRLVTIRTAADDTLPAANDSVPTAEPATDSFS